MPISYVSKIAVKKDLDLFNASKDLPLTITLKDIVEGTQKNSKACPFAIAAKRIPGVRKAYVLRTKVFLEFRDRIVRYDLPQSARNFILSFDRNERIYPGDYVLKEVIGTRQPSYLRKEHRKRKKLRATGKIPSPKKIGPWAKDIRNLDEPLE